MSCEKFKSDILRVLRDFQSKTSPAQQPTCYVQPTTYLTTPASYSNQLPTPTTILLLLSYLPPIFLRLSYPLIIITTTILPPIFFQYYPTLPPFFTSTTLPPLNQPTPFKFFSTVRRQTLPPYKQKRTRATNSGAFFFYLPLYYFFFFYPLSLENRPYNKKIFL